MESYIDTLLSFYLLDCVYDVYIEGCLMDLYTKVVEGKLNQKYVILFTHGNLAQPIYVMPKYEFEKMIEAYKNENSLEKYS